MFTSYNEFEEWLEVSRDFDKQTIADIYNFVDSFPSANFEDYIKVSKKLAEGNSIEQIKERFKKHLRSQRKNTIVEVVRMGDCEEEMVQAALTGQLQGETTHIDRVDKCWRWRPTEFSLFTGYNNDGKSLFIRYLCLIKGIMDNWKTAYYAPEDYPAISFFDELVHTASGRTTDKNNPNFIGEKLYREIVKKIKPYFYYVNIVPPENTLEHILDTFKNIVEEDKEVRICIIDPMIKITRPREYANNDSGWASYINMMCGDFARRHGICLMMVLHQLTPKLQENGTYAKPDKYSIKYGGNFADGSDNVLFLQRPTVPRDFLDTTVRFGSVKIKKQKLVGIPQEITFNFNRFTNRYVDEQNEDLFDFDGILKTGRIQLLFNN